ncbi:MAG: sugar transferase [Acidimicrobiales bacterium]
MAGTSNPVAAGTTQRAEQVLRVFVVVVAAASASAASLSATAGSNLSRPWALLVPLFVLATAALGAQLRSRRYGHLSLSALSMRWLEGSPAADAPPEPLPPLCRLLKRTVDLAAASLVLVVVLPVLVAAAVAIVIDSEGGVLFTQTRLGAGGRPFRMVKLRTMRTGNDEMEHRSYVAALISGHGEAHDGMYKLVHDARRTKVGRVLRSYSIDELPQLWNVLCGHMSLVGPRPPLPEEAAAYDEVARARLAAKPGLTGLWQVSGRSRLSFEEMVELDVRYWQEWSPVLDLRILIRTPKAVIWDRETA